MCALALVKSLALMDASEGYSRGVHGPQRPFGATFLGMPALLVLEPSELHAHMRRYDVWGLTCSLRICAPRAWRGVFQVTFCRMIVAFFGQVNFRRYYSFWPNSCLISAELCSPPSEVQKRLKSRNLPEIELLPNGRSETNTGLGMLAELGRRTQNSQLLRAHRAGAPRRRSHLTEPAIST